MSNISEDSSTDLSVVDVVSTEDSVATEPEQSSQVPRFVVDLDAPPEERWTEIMEIYKDFHEPIFEDLSDTLKLIFGDTMGSVVESLASGLMKMAAKSGLVAYGDELKAIAEGCDLPLGKLVLLQLSYEAFAACTSIVTNDKDGHPVHGRTMDWELDALRRMTIEVDFQRNGETVFLATTWAGYVGILTGVKPNGFSVSVNFRNAGTSPLETIKKGLTSAWPVGFLVRCVLEDDETYTQALGSLSASELMAPVYLTLAGVNENEGALLTRLRTEVEQPWYMENDGDVVQTNMDHWKTDYSYNICSSIERRELGRSLVESTVSMDQGAMWNIINTAPILNSINIYSCVMSPAKGTLVTTIPSLQGVEEFDEDTQGLIDY